MYHVVCLTSTPALLPCAQGAPLGAGDLVRIPFGPHHRGGLLPGHAPLCHPAALHRRWVGLSKHAGVTCSMSMWVSTIKEPFVEDCAVSPQMPEHVHWIALRGPESA